MLKIITGYNNYCDWKDISYSKQTIITDFLIDCSYTMTCTCSIFITITVTVTVIKSNRSTLTELVVEDKPG